MTVSAELNYLARGSRINRRYVAPGAELNTGQYERHRVLIHDGRPRQQAFSLDEHGFVIARRASAVADFKDKTEVDARYAEEVADIVRDLTGAQRIVPLGWVLRTAGPTSPVMQPPAADVHVDMTHARAHRLAERLHAEAVPQGAGFSRFIASSLWRCLSAPPQDWPLTVCEGRSVEPCEGVANTLVRVPVLPEGDALTAELPGEEDLPAASVFHFSAQHRWWYFPDMTPDEVILLKFHDSDHSRAWRVPHSAFHDRTRPRARVRESIEFRTIAYFE